MSTPLISEGSTSTRAPLRQSVSIFHLASIAFFLICAGPYGQEEAISAGGALLVFIGMLVIPIIYALPMALMSSELSNRFPACGGCVEWAIVLGKKMAVFNSYLRNLSCLFDNALYPVMVADYLCVLIPGMDEWYWRLLVCLLSNCFAVGCNVFGLEAVGWSSFVLSFVILCPFALFTGFAARFMSPDRVFARFPEDEDGPDYALLLATLIWQFAGFDTVGALSEEVQNPRRTFPIAMFLTVAIITTVYLLPTIAGVSAEPDLEKWESGSFASIAKELPHCSNGWLSSWISLGGAVSSLSLLNAALSCNGRELYASAKLKAYPFSGWLSTMDLNLRGDLCPIRAIVVWAVLTLPFSLFDFSMLVEWSSLLMVMGQFVQVAIFIVCRVPCLRDRCAKKKEESSSMPSYTIMAPANDQQMDGEDKFLVGGGWIGVGLVSVPVVLISGLLCVLQGWESLVVSAALVIGMYILNLIDHGVKKLIAYCRAPKPNEEMAPALVENTDCKE
jgi:amino acid transporter